MRKKYLNILLGLLFTAAVVSPNLLKGQTPAGTAITNTAWVSFDDGSGRILSLPSDTVVTITGTGELLISKSVDRETVALGDTITYDIRLQNAAGSPIFGLSIIDTLAQMLNYLESSQNGIQEMNRIRWDIPQINAGQIIHLMLKCQVIKTVYQDTIENMAVCFTSSGKQLSSNPVYSIWQPWPEATIEKTVTPQKVYVGDTLTYSFHIQNTGPMVLSEVRLFDPLPAGIEYLDSSTLEDSPGHAVRKNIGPVAKNSSLKMEFRAVVTAIAEQTLLVNNVFLESAQGLLDSSQAAVDFRGYGIGLGITKQADHEIYTAGDTVLYNIIINNSGARAGHNVVIRDTLPENLSLIESSPAPIRQGNVLTWNIPTMKSGFLDTIRVRAKIPDIIEHKTKIDNRVWARTTEGLQDSSHWQILVNSYPEFNLVKNGPARIAPGDTFSYDIIYTNIGTATAMHPTLCDTLPEALKFVKASDKYLLSPDSQAVEWLLPPLAPGESDTLKIWTSIAENAKFGEKIKNSVWLSDQKMLETSVATASSISITRPPGDGFYTYKTVDRHEASAGDTLTYTVNIQIFNKGKVDSVLIYDKLPGEVRWIRGTVLDKAGSAEASFNPATNELTIIKRFWKTGENDSIKFKVVVNDRLDYGVKHINNIARIFIKGDTLSTADSPHSDAKTQLVKTFLSTRKTVNHKMSEVGDILTYTVSIENKSTADPLFPIQITDLIPSGFRYLEKTSVLDSLLITDPEIYESDSKTSLLWNLRDTLQPGQSIQLKYRLSVGLSVQMGEHENLVFASGHTEDGLLITSETAAAAVLVRAGILDTRGFIFGKVWDELNKTGLKDIELILEDGTRVTTDSYGKFSIPNVEQGQHVLRLNEKTLPTGSIIISEGPKFMGDSKSQLIRLIPGSLIKANFAVKTKEQEKKTE